MAQRSLDAWDKVLAEEEATEKEEEEVLKDLQQLLEEQGRDNLSFEQRIAQFEKLEALYAGNGKHVAAAIFHNEADHCRRRQRQMEAAASTRRAKEEEETRKEARRLEKLKQISDALHFTPEEFQALLKEREQEERTRRRAEKEDHWGTGWTKRAAGGTPTARKSRWVQALRRCVAALMGWLRRLAPEKPTVNTK